MNDQHDVKGPAKTLRSLTWRQVNAWRLFQHGLSPRLQRREIVKAVACTGGIQAQVMSAAELALWARLDGLSAQEVQDALWQKRTLVKTWAMRATLHLIPARDFALYIAARSVDEPRNWEGYFNYYGISKKQLEAYLAAAPEILSSEPVTREQLAAALAEHTGIPELRDLLITKGWGTPLKPLAWRGDLCFGPNQGQNVTFVHPGKWMGERRPAEPYPALQEMARRYLRAYGPATVEEFAQWWGMRLTPARKLFRSIEDELETVEVEGWRAIALRETLEFIENS
ncbi:MAG: winged helix DNA-binding domain-containing protein, partial [Omnitrophica WOR_2 bacterium]